MGQAYVYMKYQSTPYPHIGPSIRAPGLSLMWIELDSLSSLLNPENDHIWLQNY